MMSGYRCRLLIIALLSMQANHLNSVGSKVSRVQMRFTKEDVCKEALKKVNPVESCPSDKISIQERSRILNCKDIRDSCSSEELVFHCVSSGDKIVEVCAPRYYLDGKYCFKFDEETGRVIPDYQVFCQECPFQHYSNDSVTYTTCSKSIRR
ncbi:uncharacterized protein LOC133200472 [Saccostrea echinata]|uniref:uncharacterized protein LOC133200472 n=1 Tax=Saccostrea echinata TaxID=191078 RepID=UPI002A7FB0A9|nr:uncharacterized protein LOC133200472 [Saccostrea echinata]